MLEMNQKVSQYYSEIVESESTHYSFFFINLGITRNTFCVGLARVGADDQKIVACSLEKMTSIDLGAPLHSMVIAAPSLHPLEEEYLEQFHV